MKKICISLAIALTFASHAMAQQAKPGDLNWIQAPATGRISNKAEFKVPESMAFLSDADTNKFLQMNGNLPQTGAYTIANMKSNWFGILKFSEEGYVKDDEKIDADALLKTLKENNQLGNEERRKQGLKTMTLEGWYFPPRYDTENKRLEWGTKLKAEGETGVTVNVTTKILGRSGYTSAILVSSPETMEKDLPEFKESLKNFSYVSGEKYSEWKQGDKVAAYGLGALVLGGAAAVATKKGGFKLIMVAVLGALAALWAMIKKFFGKN
jgi:uncharacterized membrane-anchored protein